MSVLAEPGPPASSGSVTLHTKASGGEKREDVKFYAGGWLRREPSWGEVSAS